MKLTDEQIEKRFEALWPAFTMQVRRSFGSRELIHSKGGELEMFPGHARIQSVNGTSAVLSVGHNIYWGAGVAMTSDELREIAAQAIAASIEIDAKSEQP